MAVQLSMTIRAAGDHQFRQTTNTQKRVRNIVLSDRQNSIQDMLVEVRISVGSSDGIFHKDLNMNCLCQHLFPKCIFLK
jgi:hypothetical protein